MRVHSRQKDHVVLHHQVDNIKIVAETGSVHAMPSGDLEQSAVSGAYDQDQFRVQKTMWHPVETDPRMRANVAITVNSTILPDEEKLPVTALARYGEAT